MMKTFNHTLNAVAMMAVLGIVLHSFITKQSVANASSSAPQALLSASSASMLLPDEKALKPLDKAAFDVLVQESHARPTFMMIYASWCPHCKRMFTELNQLQQQYGDAIRIVTISIDAQPEQATAFASSIAPLHLESYIITDGDAYYAIGDALRGHGLGFKGGLTNKVGVPYNAAFFKGEPVAEIAGALGGEELSSVIGDLAKAAKKQEQPSL